MRIVDIKVKSGGRGHNTEVYAIDEAGVEHQIDCVEELTFHVGSGGAAGLVLKVQAPHMELAAPLDIVQLIKD